MLASHTLIRLKYILFLGLFSTGIFCQSPVHFASDILPEIGSYLDKKQISATEYQSINNTWVWRFILAEEDLKRKVTPDLAKQLTTFVYQYDQKSHSKKGDVLQAKSGAGKEATLEMIFKQIKRNVALYNKNIDVLNVDGKLYYVIYFPHSERT